MPIARRFPLVILLGFAIAWFVVGCGGSEEPAAPAPAVETPPAADDAPVSEPAPEPADPGDAVLGHWYSDGDGSQILIMKTDNGEIEGQIVWLEVPNYDEEGDEEFGQPKRDRNNPHEELQDRPIIGLNMIHGFTYDADEGNWSGGSIYDPESGKTYKCQMKLGENDTLDVRGYIGIPALGRSTVWRRVPDGEEKNETEAPTPSA